MPEITIVLNHRTISHLMDQVDQCNKALKASYTLVEWLEIHLKEMAIARDLTESLRAIQEEHEQKSQERLEEAVGAERERLLALLEEDR